MLSLGKYLQLSLGKSHNPQEKHSDPTGSQRASWRVLGVAIISLWGIPLVMGNLEMANATTSSGHHHIDATCDFNM